MTAVQSIIVTWLATAAGGAEKSSFELCRTIRRRYQIDVILIIWHYGDVFDLTNDERSEVSVVHCHTADEYRRCLTTALSDAARSAVLFSNHRTYAIDLQLAEKCGVPSAVIFRQTPMVDEAFRTLPSPESSELEYRSGKQLDWGALGNAAALVGVSKFGARGIAGFAEQRRGIVHIYNGLRMPGEIPEIAPRPVRRFLIVARLIDWKAIDFGIEAFARLCARYPDAQLQIAGDGEDQARLHKISEQLQVGENVEFLGFVNDIRSVYLANDCLVHLSGIESFGRVVVEASLCGLPVVVPQSAGTGELVINGHTGLTFTPNDLSDCVRALEQAYHLNENDYVRLAAAGQQRAITIFNPERLAEEYVGLANSILRR